MKTGSNTAMARRTTSPIRSHRGRRALFLPAMSGSQGVILYPRFEGVAWIRRTSDKPRVGAGSPGHHPDPSQPVAGPVRTGRRALVVFRVHAIQWTEWGPVGEEAERGSRSGARPWVWRWSSSLPSPPGTGLP